MEMRLEKRPRPLANGPSRRRRRRRQCLITKATCCQAPVCCFAGFPISRPSQAGRPASDCAGQLISARSSVVPIGHRCRRRATRVPATGGGGGGGSGDQSSGQRPPLDNVKSVARPAGRRLRSPPISGGRGAEIDAVNLERPRRQDSGDVRSRAASRRAAAPVAGCRSSRRPALFASPRPGRTIEAPPLEPISWLGGAHWRSHS